MDPAAVAGLTVDDAADSRVVLRGSLTFASAAAGYAAGLRRIAALAAGDRCDFDCSALGEADSAGLAVLIEWKAEAHRRGAELGYSNLPESIARLARISDVERLLSGR
jgi:phospholipid transport system transporter-binding protein